MPQGSDYGVAMLLDVAPEPFPAGSGSGPVIILVVAVVALLGFALWRYFRKRG